MREATLDDGFTLSETAVFRDLEGEAVILELESGTYFGLNAVGARVWQLLERHDRLSTVFGALSAEYEVDSGQLERDLLALVERMADARLGSLKSMA